MAHWPSDETLQAAFSWSTERYAITTVAPEGGTKKKEREAASKGVRLAARKRPVAPWVPTRQYQETAEAFEARQKQWTQEEKERRAQKRHERTALTLAQAMPLEKGDRLEFRTGNGWEALRVLEVSEAISHRPNFGEIKVYKCESVATSKIYPQIDLSSWRGAEGACQVRKVKRAAPPPPPTPTPAEMAEQKKAAAEAARAASHQTRRKVKCWMEWARVGGDF